MHTHDVGEHPSRASPTQPTLDVRPPHNNTIYCGIERLPDEILTIVFLCLRDARAEVEASRDQPILHIPGWLPITWACRRFRTLCLESPLLWSHIGDYPHEWLLAFVERSEQSLLDVHMHLDLHGKMNIHCLLLELARVRTLVVDGSELMICFAFRKRLAIPTAELATLSLQTHLTAEPRNSVADMLSYASLLAMSESILPNAPRLRSARLSGRLLSRINASSSILSSSLRDLDIEGCYTPVELYEMLQRVTNLRSLAVRSANMSMPQAPETGHVHEWTTLKLPYLSSFTFETAFDARIVDLLSSLKVPALTSASMTFIDCDFDTDSARGTVASVLSALSTLFSQSTDGERLQYQSLRLMSSLSSEDDFLVRRSVCIHNSPLFETVSAFSDQHQSRLDRPHAAVSFLSPWTRWRDISHILNVSSFYLHIYSIAPLGAHVRDLTISVAHSSTANEWADVLRPLIRVERIKIIDDTMGMLSQVLEALSTTPLVAPALTRLAIYFGYRISDSGLWARELIGVANARRMKGQSRLRIAFEGCLCYLPHLNKQLKPFADVTWDNMPFFDDCNVEEEEMSWLGLISD